MKERRGRGKRRRRNRTAVSLVFGDPPMMVTIVSRAGQRRGQLGPDVES